MRVWGDEARGGDASTVYRSPACRRLGVLLHSSPDLVRPVLEQMDGVLTRYVANRLQQAGVTAIGAAVTCAMAGDLGLRQRARAVLRQVLAKGIGQANREPYFQLPSRTAAAFLVDRVVGSAQDDRTKVELLVDLLPGCEDDATTLLVGGVLLCYPDLAFPCLHARWWAGGCAGEATASPELAVLGRFGPRFLAPLVGALAGNDEARTRQALTGVHAVTRLIGRFVLTRTGCLDAGLEWRVGGGLREEEIDSALRQSIGQPLTARVSDTRTEIRDSAIAALGALGGRDHADVLRSCLRPPAAGAAGAPVRGTVPGNHHLREMEPRSNRRLMRESQSAC